MIKNLTVIGRQLIPRYFRTLLDGGMNEMYYVIKGPSRETPTPGILIFVDFEVFFFNFKNMKGYNVIVQMDWRHTSAINSCKCPSTNYPTNPR